MRTIEEVREWILERKNQLKHDMMSTIVNPPVFNEMRERAISNASRHNELSDLLDFIDEPKEE